MDNARQLLPLLQGIARGKTRFEGVPEPARCAEAVARSRCEILLRRVGLPGASLEHLRAVWCGTLAERPCSSEELLSLGRGATLRSLPDASAALRWERAIRQRIVTVGAASQMMDRFEPGMPPSMREGWLEAGPLLVDWPSRLRDHPLWATIPSPLPSMPPLPLDAVWVDTRLLSPGDPHEPQGPSGPASQILDRLRDTAVLIGAPGAGKTTLMKWLARHLVSEPDGRYLLPLYVPLRAFGEALRRDPALALLDHALEIAGIGSAQQRELWGSALSYLAAGRRETVLLLLDGWDEVAQPDRGAVLQQITQHAHGFATVISSRRSGNPQALPAVQHVEMTALGWDSIDRLARRWLAAAQRSALADPFLDHLRQHPDLKRLAQTPFGLTLLCGIAASRSHGVLTLPPTRTALYTEAIGLIIADHNRRYAQAPVGAVRRARVGALALWLLESASGAPRYVFDASEVAHQTGDAGLLPEVLRPSRLISAAQADAHTFQFLHTTFHEFFAAEGLNALSEGAIGARLARHAHDLAWLEVLRFAAGLDTPRLAHIAARPDRFGVLDIRLARLLAEKRPPDGGAAILGVDLRPRLWAAILRGLEVTPFAEALAELDPLDLLDRIAAHLPGAGDALRARLLRIRGRIARREASAAQVAQIRSGDASSAAIASYGALDAPALQALRALAADPHAATEARCRAVRTLGRAQDHGATSLLLPLLDDAGLRAEAAQALGNIGGLDAVRELSARLSVAPLFVAALGTCPDREATQQLIEALAVADEAAALPFLEALTERPFHAGAALVVSLLRDGASAAIREGAAWALCEATGSGITEALAAAAQDDPEPAVRAAALGAIRRQARPVDAGWLEAIVRDQEAPLLSRDNALTALLQALGQYREQADGPWLLQRCRRLSEAVLADPRGELAFTAASHAHIVGPSLVARLTAILRDAQASRTVQEAAATSLGRVGAAAAVPVLRAWVVGFPQARDDAEMIRLNPEERVARSAADALARLAPEALLAIPGRTAEAALLRYSLRTGTIVYPDRLVRPGEPLMPLTPAAAAQPLAALLCDAFTDPELRALVQEQAGGSEMAARLPGPHAPLAQLAQATHDLWAAHGWIIPELSEILISARPLRADEIRTVMAPLLRS